jgi:predicted GH43/DUF377 family glycosyl hydrolase
MHLTPLSAHALTLISIIHIYQAINFDDFIIHSTGNINFYNGAIVNFNRNISILFRSVIYFNSLIILNYEIKLVE